MDSDSINISSDALNDIIQANLDDLNINWINTGANDTIGTVGAYTYSADTTSISPWVTTSIDNTLQVHGDSEFAGDITVKGRSLTEFMDSVEQRLNILRPNPALEAEWVQLRELGEQYRKLEQQLIEKEKVWKILNR